MERTLTPEDVLRSLREVALDLNQREINSVTYDLHQRQLRPDLPTVTELRAAWPGTLTEAIHAAGLVHPSGSSGRRLSRARSLVRNLRAELTLARGGEGLVGKVRRSAAAVAVHTFLPPIENSAVIGYRSWVRNRNNELRPMSVGGSWLPGANEAVCQLRCRHDAPAWSCGCGFHAWSRLEPALTMACGPDVVVGAIAACGRLEQHHDGFRAEKAQILGLLLPEQVDADLLTSYWAIADRYRVPLFPTPQELKAHAKRFAKPFVSPRDCRRWSPTSDR